MKIKQLLRLYTLGKSKSYISNHLGISRNTVAKYIQAYLQKNLTYDEAECMSDVDLIRLFEPEVKQIPLRRRQLFEQYKKLEKELKKPGSSRWSFWEEYCKNNPLAYSYSRFCENFRMWQKQTNPSLHIEHKAGDKLFVDFAGKRLHIVDKSTGELIPVEVFVSVLGCSQHTYVEAVYSQKKEDFIHCIENALWYYRGVPQVIVPDNLRSAVKKANLYEAMLNETFEDFLLHYQTHGLPTRIRKPKDKSLVEGGVKIVYQRIYRHLRDQVFHNLEDLNKAIKGLLNDYNSKHFKGKDYSRIDIYNDLEKQYMNPLPATKYEIREYAMGTVHKNCHVYLSADKHYYSVPYQYIGKKIKIKYTSKNVWVYYRFEEIAIHLRDKTRYGYSTIKSHLPAEHQYVTDWHPERFMRWAAEVGPNTCHLIQHILNRNKYPEQNYKSCLGVLHLEKKVGRERLENACLRALEYQIHNYSIVKRILEKGLDLLQEQQFELTLPEHNNIRGNNYYQ